MGTLIMYIAISFGIALVVGVLNEILEWWLG